MRGAIFWYCLGVWTMTGIVLLHEWLKQRRERRAERAFLEIQAKLYAVAPVPGESNEELRERITSILRGPFR